MSKRITTVVRRHGSIFSAKDRLKEKDGERQRDRKGLKEKQEESKAAKKFLSFSNNVYQLKYSYESITRYGEHSNYLKQQS
jgi:hypothetical protein